MQSYRQKTELLYPVPKRVQELIPVYRIAKDGVFQIERTGEDGQALFDKAYLFSDTNFTPMDDREKGEFLKQYCSALNSLNVPFKLLVINQNRDMDVSIYGYTDNQGWKNSTAAQSQQKNLNLSQERAQSVSSYLLSCGVSTNQIKSVQGMGESDPVASNDTAAGREQNRRVEVYMYASEQMIRDAQAATH